MTVGKRQRILSWRKKNHSWTFSLWALVIFASTFSVSNLVAASSDENALAKCQVINDQDVDVTMDHLVDADPAVKDYGVALGYVLCEGNYACKNYTITNCPAVRCSGSEACYLTKIEGVSRLLECDGTHSCHRAEIDFAELALGGSNLASITCQGEGACDVAQIDAPHAKLECFGRKACRKIDAHIDVVHCTHGDAYYEACSGYAGLHANCVLCGWQGCNSHVNVCRFKHEEDAKWVACKPETAQGEACTAVQKANLDSEIKTSGQIMVAHDSGDNTAEESAAEGDEEGEN